MTPRVLNMHTTPPSDLEGAIYVGRGSKWGNPFKLSAFMTRSSAIERYAAWLVNQPGLVRDLQSLRGKNLACWCSPAQCHAEVLLQFANMDTLIPNEPTNRAD